MINKSGTIRSKGKQMTLSDDLYHIAAHIGDDQPNLPEGAKNTLLLAAKRLEEYEADELDNLWDTYSRTHYRHDKHIGWYLDGCTADSRWSAQELIKRGLIEKHPSVDWLSRPVAARLTQPKEQDDEN